MRTAAVLIGVIFTAAVGCLSVAWVETGHFGGLFFEPPEGSPQVSVWRGGLAAFVMILGVYVGSVHSQVKNAVGQIRIGEELRGAWQRPGLWRGLLATPIVFGAVYSSLDRQPDFVLGLLFAFQNGFFCDKIMEQKGVTD